MKKQVLSILSLLLFGSAEAQWQPRHAGFSNDTLGFYEISIPNRQTAWAVCFDGKGSAAGGRFIRDFTRTTDGGDTWTPGKVSNDATLQFSTISAIDENEAWVAMNKRFLTGGGIFHTIDGGVTWEHVLPGELFDANSFPNTVHFKDKNKGIAIGDPNGGYFEVYTTMNKGKKWKRVPAADLPAPLPNEYGWISGHYVVGNTIWFGTTAGRMYKSIDYGKTWTVHVVDPAGSAVFEIAFNDDGLRGVTHLRNGFGTFLWATEDGGATWTNLGQPANWKSSRITAVPGTNALVSTAVNAPAFRGSAISYDNGRTWIELERATSKAACRFLDAETGYAGGFYVTGPPLQGGLFKSSIVFEPAPAATPRTSRSNVPVAAPEAPLAAASVSVYPSPARSVLNIVLDDAIVNAKSDIRLVSMDGRVVATRRSVNAKLVPMDVSRLAPGTYIVHIGVNNQSFSHTVTVAR